MRLLFSFGCVAACVMIGGRLAWNALELSNWSDESTAWSVADLFPSRPQPAPAPASTAVLVEDSLVPTLMLPKVGVLDRLNRPARGTFGSRETMTGPTTINGAIVVPPLARSGASKPASRSSTSGTKSAVGSYDSAPHKAFGLTQHNPITSMLNGSNYVKPKFNFTSESRRQNTAAKSRTIRSSRRSN